MNKNFRLVMLVLFVLVVVAECTLFASNTSRITTNNQIQIGTYNLEFLTDLSTSTGAWCEQHTKHTVTSIKALAKFIDSLDIEVLALQEVENSAALDKLLTYMPANKYAYIISRQVNQCQRVAIIYQPKKVSLTYAGNIPLNPPGHHNLRNGLVVYGKVKPNGFDFTLVDVHLKAYQDAKDEAIRNQQLNMLGNWISTYLSNISNDPDLIIAGDFNEHLLTNKYAFSLLNNGLGLKDLDKDSPNKTCTPGREHYSVPIDYIIISPDAQKEYTGITTLDNYFANSNLLLRESFSDHCILWSNFNTKDLDAASQTYSTETTKTYSGTISGAQPIKATKTITNCSTHILIDEVEQNPAGRDSGHEWVKLYNPSDKNVDIGGWSLETTHGKTVTILISQREIIKAHGYTVVTYYKKWLDNKNESIILRNSDGNEIDRTPILSDTHNDNRDWQRYPACKDTDSSSDWQFKPST